MTKLWPPTAAPSVRLPSIRIVWGSGDVDQGAGPPGRGSSRVDQYPPLDTAAGAAILAKWGCSMKRDGLVASLWKRDKEEGFASILYKLLFLVLVFGLVLLMALERAGGGLVWVRGRLPILEDLVEYISPDVLYFLWLVSIWLGFKVGKHVGMKRGAVNERRRLGIAF